MTIDDPHQLRTCLVLGGRGFIGRPLVLRLLKLGNWIVRVADSAKSLQLDPSEQDSLLSESFSTGRAAYFHVDVRDKPQIIKAIEGSSVVFYMDPIDLPIYDFYLCYTIIVQGAKNVINACRQCKVKQLIYNSCADVVFDSSHDIHNGDESLPYAKCENMLVDLKAQAEALVLFANDIDGLLTCALRPMNVFGPGDVQLVPALLNVAKSGWAKFIIGSSEKVSNFTYVENVAYAHICAEEALRSRMVVVSGKVFFITNFEAMKFWDFASLLLEGLGYQSPMIKIPAGVISYIISLVKWVYSKMDSKELGIYHSISNIVQLAACTRTFSCSAAKKDLGYAPVISLQEGISSTIESFSEFSTDSSCIIYTEYDQTSKVDKLLGGGKVAEILLWRDETKTFTHFLALVLLYYWFFLCGRAFISSAAKLLLLFMSFLFGYSFLPSNIFGFRIPRLCLSCLEVSEVDMGNFVTSIVYLWNRVNYVIRLLAQGEDWNLFFKMSASLYFFKLILSKYFTTAIGVALIVAFTCFFIYEQYEEEFDEMVRVFSHVSKKALAFSIRSLPPSVKRLLFDCEISDVSEKSCYSKSKAVNFSRS